MSCPIHIGIAGWSYPDWKNIVYTHAKSDALEYVSGFVDCIEINNTFYRPPDEKTARSWLESTRDQSGFFFTAKLLRDFTHEGKIEPETVKAFHKGFEPLLEANRLKQLLAQFKFDYSDTAANREHLSKIAASFSGAFRLAVELRHKSWESLPALDFLERLGVSVCNLDYPVASNSFNLKECRVGETGYFRMHGRNTEKWFSKAGRDETYDYYYNTKELDEIKSRIERLSQAFKAMTVIANNHYRAAELANALELKAMITHGKVPVPAKLIETYPNLARIALNA